MGVGVESHNCKTQMVSRDKSWPKDKKLQPIANYTTVPTIFHSIFPFK